MGREFEAERKKFTRFFVTAVLFHTRNKDQIVTKLKH